MAAVVILRELSDMLADPEGEAYANAQAAVEAADTVRDAVEAVGILEERTDEIVPEARAVLDAIPAAVDEAIIAALESAFERGVPVVLDWFEGERGTVEVHVSEERHRNGVRVRIVIVAPDGRTFLV
jgi:hypothetical protein